MTETDLRPLFDTLLKTAAQVGLRFCEVRSNRCTGVTASRTETSTHEYSIFDQRWHFIDINRG